MALIRIRIRRAVVFEQVQADFVGDHLLSVQQFLPLIQVEEIWPDWRRLELPDSIHELGHHCLEQDPPVYFPLPQQSTKDGVANCHRHPGWLFRVEDGDEKFQHTLSPGIFAVSYGEPVLRVCGIPELPTDKFVRPGCKSLSSCTKSICLSPPSRVPGFRPCSNSSLILVWGSHDQLPHHFLFLHCLGFV